MRETYAVGDIVTKTPMYSSNYPAWDVDRGVISKITERFVADQSLGTSDRALYRNRYGAQDRYPIFEMIVSTADGDFLVSQFGFNKDVVR